MSAVATLPPQPSPQPSPHPRGWFFGPAPDLLLGCGLGYAIVLGALCVFGTQVREDLSPGFLPFLAVVIGAPHYGATILRVYERRSDRRTYALFAVHATILLAVLFAVATQWLPLGSLLLTIYVTWSPWHYTGQNYGLAILFLRRRGVPIDPITKRWLYVAFVLSYAAVFMAIHSDAPGSSYTPPLYIGDGYQVLSLHIPGTIGAAIFDCVLLGYAVAFAVAVVRLLRVASAAALAPSIALALTQVLWFGLPVAVRRYGVLQDVEPFSARYAGWYFFWAALAHSIQYVWITSYFARGVPGYAGMKRYLAKALFAGTALWCVPALLFAPDRLGRLPFDAGLGALVASIVNLHHFVLDGAIWKLRDGRIARVLLRTDAAAEAAAPESRPRFRPLRTALFAIGAASFAVMLAAYYESEFAVAHAYDQGDVDRMRTAITRLEVLGRESAVDRLHLGELLAKTGDLGGAVREYQRSTELHETPKALITLSNALERTGDTAQARAALERAFALWPTAPNAYHAALLASRTGDDARAVVLLTEAVRLDPMNKRFRDTLERTRERLAGSGAAAQ